MIVPADGGKGKGVTPRGAGARGSKAVLVATSALELCFPIAWEDWREARNLVSGWKKPYLARSSSRKDWEILAAPSLASPTEGPSYFPDLVTQLFTV